MECVVQGPSPPLLDGLGQLKIPIEKLVCIRSTRAHFVCAGRSGDEHLDSSGLYPVMLHQNTSVFPSTSAGYPPGFPGGASATATSQQPGFPGTSTSQSDLFNPVPGTSQDGADPSGGCLLSPFFLFIARTDQTVVHLAWIHDQLKGFSCQYQNFEDDQFSNNSFSCKCYRLMANIIVE